MFRLSSLKFKMLLSVCGVVVLSTALSIFTITQLTSSRAETEAEQKASEIAQVHATRIKGQLDHTLDVARTVAHAFEGLKSGEVPPSRDTLNDILKKVLARNPEFIAIDTCWEPDALDGRDDAHKGKPGHDESGRFVPYWNRGNGTIALDALIGYEKEDWYVRPRNTGREIITEPYVYPVGGKDVLMATVVAPIKKNGKFLGMVAIDIALDTFARMMDRVHPFETGYGYLLSNSGYIVAHPKGDLIGKNAIDVIDAADRNAFASAIRNGSSHTLIRKSARTGQKTWQILVPISVGETDTPWSLGVVIPFDKILEGSRELRNVNLAIGFGSVLLLTLVVWLITTRIVVRPLRKVSDILQDIAQGEGDLTQRIPVTTKDEIGVLSEGFNTFVEKLQHLIRGLADQAVSIEGSAANLVTIAGDLSTSAAEGSGKSGEVASATEEMSASISMVAATMEQAAGNTGMVATTAEQLTATIHEIAQHSDSARETTRSAVDHTAATMERMTRLNEAAAAIGNVSETITDISEQTNLLALNATIEAARAGEAGKGFAVVANEIKVLATQTAEATQDIKSRVDGIQSVTQETVKEIEQVSSVIQDVNDTVGTIATAVEEQSAATSEIADNISQASTGINQVTRNLSESSVVVDTITSDIADVNRSAVSISGASTDLHDRAEELTSMSDKLKAIVDTFRI